MKTNKADITNRMNTNKADITNRADTTNKKQTRYLLKVGKENKVKT